MDVVKEQMQEDLGILVDRLNSQGKHARGSFRLSFSSETPPPN